MQSGDAQQTSFSAASPDEFRERISPVAPNAPTVQTIAPRFRADVHQIVLPRMPFFSLRVGEARIGDPEASDAVGINIPLTGNFRFRTVSKTHEVAPGGAFVRRPGYPFDMTTPRDASVLVVHLLEPLLTSFEGKLGRRLRFDEVVSLQTPEGRSFSRYLNFVWGELQRSSVFPGSPVATRELENSLAAAFLTVAELGHRTKHAGIAAPRPPYLARAEEYVRSNLRNPLSVLDVAAAAGVGPRQLSAAFRRHRGVSTSAFVRQLRLEAAHRDLLSASPSATRVTDVAIRYSLTHLGRFSGDYRRLFGETPSETLRRC
jgi:AraC-like DNA-binding protein